MKHIGQDAATSPHSQGREEGNKSTEAALFAPLDDP